MIREIHTMILRMDPAGSGKFGARRGKRAHTGIDYVCTPGAEILSPVDGVVTKRGYAYSDDLSWRIVDVKDRTGMTHRLFYVEPCVDEGQRVTRYTPIGRAQDITQRYPAKEMLPHVHYQIEDEDGEIVNPDLMASRAA